ncbi:MAG: glycosyltransferase family 9 protein, partial [Nitrospirota bacterium]
IIHSLPFLKAIKNTFPDACIEWVISKNLKEILETNPLIDRLIVFDKDSWKRLKNLPETLKEIAGLVKTLKANKYDAVIDLQGLLRSGIITFFAPSPVKIGFKHAREGSSFFYNRKIQVDSDLHAVDKCLEIAKAIRQGFGVGLVSSPCEAGMRSGDQGSGKVEFPLNVDKTAADNIKKLLCGLSAIGRSASGGKEKEYAVIVPSARWETKKWPAENFSRLISKLRIQCVLAGSSADKDVAQEVIGSSSGSIINLCGKTNLKELVALIAGAKVVVSNDSGPMHIAAALGVPVIALFGPTDPVKTGPYGWQGNKNLKVIRTSISCSPCFKKKCKEPLCMKNISVEQVFEGIREYL